VLSGASTYQIASALLDADNVTIHLTMAHKMLNGTHTITVYNVPDTGTNCLSPNPSSENFTYTYVFPLQEIVILSDANYTEGSLIAVDTIGVQSSNVFPEGDLQIDNTTVDSFTTDTSSGTLLKHRLIQRKVYTHPGHVAVDQLKIDLTNAVTGPPDENPLEGWDLDPLSTAVVSCEQELNIQLVKILLTETANNPSELNSLRCSLATVDVDKALTTVAKFRAPLGVQGRMELWLSGTLYEAANFNGLGIGYNDWLTVSLPAVIPTGTDLDPELRLITNSPDTAGIYTEWTEVFVNQELITNPDFTPGISPWVTNIDSNLIPSLESEPAGTFVRCTVVKAVEPLSRYYHNMVYDASRSVHIMFGGTPTSGVYANDMYEFDDSGTAWELIAPFGGTAPSVRGRFGFVYDSSRGICILFGGRSASTSNGETWEYNGTTATWVQKASGAVVKPSARYSPAVSFDSSRNVFVLFGGYTAAGCDAETWEYAVATSTWSLIAPFGGIKPSARYNAAMVYNAALGKCVLFGGVTTTARDSETWTYDGVTSTWAIVSPTWGIHPSGRSEHSMVYDSDRQVCILYGGQDGSAYPQVDHYVGDTWEYYGTSSTWLNLDDGSGAGVTSPYELVAFAMSYDTSTNKSILFSGVNWAHGGRVSQTWSYDNDTVVWTLFDFNPTHGRSVSHLNSLSSPVSPVYYAGKDVTCAVTAKCRAPVGTVGRVHLYTQPWVALVTVGNYYDLQGTGDWEDVFIVPLTTSDTCPSLVLWLITLSPDSGGTYVDWKTISVVRNLIPNSYFRTRSLVIDKIIIDGRGYQTTGPEIYSTGTWLPGDGPTVVPGHKNSDFLSVDGSLDYGEISDDDLFAGVDARIDTYRKGNGVVRVINAGLTPIAGATVSVSQTKHEFLFGTQLNLWEGFQLPLTPAEQILWARYQVYLPQLFNFITQPFYWNDNEYVEGVLKTAIRTAESEWIIANGMSCKGHPLFWHYSEANWLKYKDLSTIKSRVLDYVSIQPTLHNTRIQVWDVVNEISTWDKSGFLTEHSPATTRMWLQEGYIPFLKEVFNTARAAAGPNATLLANDFYMDDNYYTALKKLDDGAGGYLFDAVGMQSHMHDEVYSNQKLWNICNKFGALTGNIHFTELSILSGPAYELGGIRATYAHEPMPVWDSTPAGEIQQAIETIRVYKLLFSHPYVKAITWWNISDYKSWMLAPRGLLDINMLPKQAYTDLDQLINTEWKTHTSGVTDSFGEFAFRGFAGTYDITVTAPGHAPVTQSVTLTTSGATWNVIV